jgi:tRNA-guanine family transglycosylase
MTTPRKLVTRRGEIRLPAYVPVTTFGQKYPLDRLIQPYLPRLASAMMVAYHYAKQMDEEPRLPLLVDSGGFASLFADARVVAEGDIGVLELVKGESLDRTHPRDVLDLQERIADVAFTLDFPIPPGMDKEEAQRRLDLTIKNAHWALANRKRKDMLLFACVQAWDTDSARECARTYAKAGFDGIAIGGLVPRARDLELVLRIVDAVRAEIGDLPLHVFGLGKPETVDTLYKAGVDSVDSSSYVKLAADGRLWSDPAWRKEDPSSTDRLQLALCNLATATGRTLPLGIRGIVFPHR